MHILITNKLLNWYVGRRWGHL